MWIWLCRFDGWLIRLMDDGSGWCIMDQVDGCRIRLMDDGEVWVADMDFFSAWVMHHEYNRQKWRGTFVCHCHWGSEEWRIMILCIHTGVCVFCLSCHLPKHILNSDIHGHPSTAGLLPGCSLLTFCRQLIINIVSLFSWCDRQWCLSHVGWSEWHTDRQTWADKQTGRHVWVMGCLANLGFYS